MPGVEKVTWANWFGGQYGDGKRFFANFAVDAKTYLDVYPEMSVPADQREAFIQDRSGALIGARLIDLFGWKVGQNVTLRGTIYPGEWTFTVRGVYTPTDPVINDDAMMFHWAVPRRDAASGSGQAGWYILQIDRPENGPPRGQGDRRPVPQLERAHQDRHRAGVQRQLRHDVGQRRPADEHDRHGGGVRDPAGGRERDDDERPRADPRAGGAQDDRLLRPAAVRAGDARGGGRSRSPARVLGLGAAKVLYKSTNFNAAGFLPGFDVTGATLAVGAAIALVLMLASGIVPAVRAARLPVVAALRNVE